MLQQLQVFLYFATLFPYWLDFGRRRNRMKATSSSFALGQVACASLPSVSRSLELRRVVSPVNKPDVYAFMLFRRVSSNVYKMSFIKKGKPRSPLAFGHPFKRVQANSGTDSFSLLTGLRWSLVRGLSTTTKSMQYDLSKSEISKSGHKKLLFDTHALVRLLEDNGFTVQQAEVVINLLVKTTNSNMDIMYSDMVTKTQQEIMLQKVMSHIAAVKKDMIILEKSEFSALLAENERIKVELAQLNMQLSDMMNKVRLDNKLDMNLEKSQMNEMKAEHERRLLGTRHSMMEMIAEQDRHVTQNNVKIDTEVAGLKTMLESHKLDSIKYLAGSVFTCLTVVLGFYRIWM